MLLLPQAKASASDLHLQTQALHEHKCTLQSLTESNTKLIKDTHSLESRLREKEKMKMRAEEVDKMHRAEIRKLKSQVRGGGGGRRLEKSRVINSVTIIIVVVIIAVAVFVFPLPQVAELSTAHKNLYSKANTLEKDVWSLKTSAAHDKDSIAKASKELHESKLKIKSMTELLSRGQNELKRMKRLKAELDNAKKGLGDVQRAADDAKRVRAARCMCVYIYVCVFGRGWMNRPTLVAFPVSPPSLCHQLHDTKLSEIKRAHREQCDLLESEWKSRLQRQAIEYRRAAVESANEIKAMEAKVMQLKAKIAAIKDDERGKKREREKVRRRIKEEEEEGCDERLSWVLAWACNSCDD